MAYHLYQTEAFVLDERPFGEANRIYHLLTPDLGLVTATAQGVRLLKSKLRFNLDKYIHVRVTLVRGKEVWRLIGVERTGDYENLYSDQTKLKFAVKIFSLLRRFIQGETTQKLLFEDLKLSLGYLAELKLLPADQKLFSAWEQVTVLRLLYFLGYVKNIPKLISFINFKQWTLDILRKAHINQGFLVGIINEAIEVSHI